MAQILVWLMLIAGAATLLIGVWPLLKKLLPTSWQTSTAATVADKVDTYADEAVAWTALRTSALLFKQHGDSESAALLGGLASKVMAWDDVPTKLDPPAVEGK